MHFANTGNVLVHASLFEHARFSERFALSGGEDTHFFLRAARDGARIVWAADARVHEEIPPERMRVGWIARREFRRGNTLSLCLLDLDPSPRRRLKRVLHAVLRIGVGAAQAGCGAVAGRRLALRGVQNAAFGSGLLFGLTGRGYAEYARER